MAVLVGLRLEYGFQQNGWNGMKWQALAVFPFGVLALMIGADSAGMMDCCCNGMNE